MSQVFHTREPTCGVKASQLAVDTMDVQPGGYFFAFLDAGVGAQRARRLRLHLGGRGVLLQHHRGPAMFQGVGSFLYDPPERRADSGISDSLKHVKHHVQQVSESWDYIL